MFLHITSDSWTESDNLFIENAIIRYSGIIDEVSYPMGKLSLEFKHKAKLVDVMELINHLRINISMESQCEIGLTIISLDFNMRY